MLPVPDILAANGVSVSQIENEFGQPIDADYDPNRGQLRVPGWLDASNAKCAAVWLEYRAPGQFRIVAEPMPAGEAAALNTEQGIPITLDPDNWQLIRGRAAHLASLDESALALRAARLATHAGFDQLMCLPLVRDMELLEHQIRTAKTVLRRLRGRALLCDEVGLGKTIEAGLVMDELHTRGLAKSILLLVPPSLIEQWQGEMRRKFGLEFISHDDPAFREHGKDAWTHFDRIIVSMHTAKREPHRSAIVGRKWDMIVVDEAHHLRNRNTQVWQLRERTGEAIRSVADRHTCARTIWKSCSTW